MTILDIGADAVEDTGGGGRPDGFGPDRSLSLDDTANVPLAPARGSLPDFVLGPEKSVPTWSQASERLVRRLQADSPHSPRFGGNWAERTRARLLRADECMREWCRTTVLLTFTGSPYLTDDADRPMPPTSFVQALTASRSARNDELRDVLEDTGGRWVTMRVVGAHQSGYPHEHMLVGTEARVSSEEFEAVVGAHRDRDGSPVAGDGAHGVGSIRVESDPNRDEMTGGVQYVAPDVPGIRDVLEAEQSERKPVGVIGESEHRQRTASVLEATGTQAVRIDSSDGVDADWY